MSLRLAAAYLGTGLIVTAHWITFYSAIKLANASVAATCMALAPVFVALIEPKIVGRRFEPRELLFGIVMVPGVALVVGGTPAGMRTGIAIGIVSSFFSALFSVLNKRLVEHAAPLTVTGLEMAAGSICLTIFAPRVWPGRHDALLILVLAIGCTLVPYVLSLVALRHLSAFSAALAVNMEPVYSIVLAVALLGEQRELTSAFYAGVAIILAAVFTHRR